jgi:putative transposase
MSKHAYTFRLYPTRKQQERLQWTLDRARELYNAALQERRDAYRMVGKSLNYYDQANQLPEIDNRVSLSKIGSIKVKLHRKIQGTVKTCTIKREGDAWSVIFACEVKDDPLPENQDVVGIDLGLLHFATLSDGSTIENPRHYRRAEKHLKKVQEALSRKKRGSHRRKKAVQGVAKAHRKVANQRRDFLHKESRKLVNAYGTIVFEELQPATLSKRPKPKQAEDGTYLPNGAAAKGGVNKSINDAGWSQFVQFCTYKAESAGRNVVHVNPRYTSQVCSGCGTVKKKTLDERWHSCECGCSLDRDHNAAINILRLGRSHQEAQAS